MSEKPYEPSAKRLREVRAQGDIPFRATPSTVLFLWVLPFSTVFALKRYASYFEQNMRSLSNAKHSGTTLLSETITILITTVIPVLMFFATCGILGAVLQNAFVLASKKPLWDMQRTNFSWKRLWNKENLYTVIQRAIAVIVLGAFLTYLIVEKRPHHRTNFFSIQTWEQLRGLIMFAGLFMLCFALIEIVIHKRLWLHRHRMSRDELLREQKEEYGHQEGKRYMNELQRNELPDLWTNIEKIALVLTHEENMALALFYQPKGADQAPPKIWIKAQENLARRLIHKARFCEVPIIEDKLLTIQLFKLAENSEIPASSYERVAELLHRERRINLK